MAQTILVVDDEPSICHNLAAYLEDEGLVVHTACSGEEALLRINAGLGADVCVMDLRLPGMNGVDAIIAIRRHIPTMRFVIHTGSENDTVAATLEQAGLDRLPILRKPLWDMNSLTQLIHADPHSSPQGSRVSDA